MKQSRKRGFLLFAAAIAVMAVGYVVRIDGALRPVQPAVTVALANATMVTPALYRGDADRNGVYVVFGAPRPDGLFDATRVEVRTGAQSPAVIAIGPGSAFSPFTEGEIRAEVTGLSLKRPMFHLLSIPEGRGPGVHYVGSDTGVVRLTTGAGAARRTLVERRVFNSSTTGELRSHASTDAGGQIVAVVSRSSGGWTLHLFHNLPEES